MHYIDPKSKIFIQLLIGIKTKYTVLSLKSSSLMQNLLDLVVHFCKTISEHAKTLFLIHFIPLPTVNFFLREYINYSLSLKHTILKVFFYITGL